MHRSISTAFLAVALSGVATVSPAQRTMSHARTAAASVLTARETPAGRYEYTSIDDDGDVSTGAVTWMGRQMRIDPDHNATRRRSGGSDVNVATRRGEYFLVDFASNQVRIVRPGDREINEMPMQTFEQIIGRALGMVGMVVQMQVLNAGIVGREVGPGGQVAGVDTRQYRLTEEFDVQIGVFGMKAETKHHRVVTDYWVATSDGPPRNPMFELMLRAPSATSQQDAAHQANVARARTALFAGAPMKAVVTATETGAAPKRTSIEITSVSTATPSAAVFALPSGYRVKHNDLNVRL